MSSSPLLFVGNYGNIRISQKMSFLAQCLPPAAPPFQNCKKRLLEHNTPLRLSKIAGSGPTSQITDLAYAKI